MVGRGTKPPLKAVSKVKMVKLGKKPVKVQKSIDSYCLDRVISVNTSRGGESTTQKRQSGSRDTDECDHDHDHDTSVDLEAFVSTDGAEWVDVEEGDHSSSTPTHDRTLKSWSQVAAPSWGTGSNQ